MDACVWQLTYWSLQEYDHVPAVKSGRKAMCKQMTALMLSQWQGHRHICENYSPHKTADDHKGDCSGTKFYHWFVVRWLCFPCACAVQIELVNCDAAGVR
jgi:hypothetical protein